MNTTAARPRIIERWFPSAEVSAASGKGWGSSNSETLLMSWFAKRPLAQSRAATLCSLLPWPDTDLEQQRVIAIIRESLGACQDPDYMPGRNHKFGIQDCARYDKTNGYNAARTDVLGLLADAYPDRPARTLDPFSGRGLIPLESARFGIQADAVDYSPVAALASRLLIDYPFRDWDNEPDLPYGGYNPHPWRSGRTPRLVHDIESIQQEVEQRWQSRVDKWYPKDPDGNYPWGYLWAATIPCNECGRWFPLYASNTLRLPNRKKNDVGQSFELRTSGDTWSTSVVDGQTAQSPTMLARDGIRGKLAWCPFRDCGHAHELREHQRLVAEHHGTEAILAVGVLTEDGKDFRPPTKPEINAAIEAVGHVAANPHMSPNERIFPGTSRIMGYHYGARTYGDLSTPRQNLAHHHLAETIAELGNELIAASVSADYSAALTGYCGAVFARKLKRSSRGARLQTAGGAQVGDIFVNESTIAYNYDFFEVGPGLGPGSWDSVGGVPAVVRNMTLEGGAGRRSVRVQRGSALALPMRTDSFDAVITDPPYDAMINYSDASDLFYVWLKRALRSTHPDFAMTAHPWGTQENADEIIVSHFYNYDTPVKDHRTPERYDRLIAEAFTEINRLVHPDGVVSIVFGHGEPEVWRRLLDAISRAGLVLTGTVPLRGCRGSLSLSGACGCFR